MRILVVGGGSGGHVTPVLAVLSALKAKRPRAELRFWCDRSFLAATESLVDDAKMNVPVRAIFSGKLRRYYGVPLYKQLLDIPTTLKNVRDGLFIGIGFIQSLVLLLLWYPDAIFTKGGFVCLPVGLAAKVLGIPLVIHDSDAHPGLTNRVLSRFATSIATGAPVEYYPYDSAKTTYVGIPIAAGFTPLSDEAKAKVKVSLGFDPSRPLIVVTGGGLGAKRLNDAIVASAPSVLKNASVLQITGRNNYEAVLDAAPKRSDYKILGFVSQNMNLMLGGADLAVVRAGATTMLELAGLGTPAILVPNAQLTGNHQTKNAKVYADAGAAVVISESAISKNPGLLAATINELLADDARRSALGAAIATFARPQAAEQVADMILHAARGER